MTGASFEELLARDGVLAYTNVGISMLPLLREGKDIMLLRAKGDQPVRRLDAVLFRRPHVQGRGAYVLHRVLRVNPDGSYWIIGDNCAAGETVAEENVLAVLTAVVRDGKTIPVTSLRCRLYVNTWCRFYRTRIFLTALPRLLRRAVSKLKRSLKR